MKLLRRNFIKSLLSLPIAAETLFQAKGNADPPIMPSPETIEPGLEFSDSCFLNVKLYDYLPKIHSNNKISFIVSSGDEIIAICSVVLTKNEHAKTLSIPLPVTEIKDGFNVCVHGVEHGTLQMHTWIDAYPIV